MAAEHGSPFFSIIISTRNRSSLFERALQSVRAQGFASKEIIVIVDGSSDEQLACYRAIEEHWPEISFNYLTHRENGHGQSYTMNCGATLSRGRYICFLDDDDYWTDDNYLEIAHQNLETANCQAEMHYSNQKAYHADGSEHKELVWLEDLIPQVQEASSRGLDCYQVDADFLLRSHGFGHLNCSMFSRSFYLAIGGMDESIRYENDRDVFIRSIDAASYMLFSTRYISRHNIPDASKRENMSTAASAVEKKLYQIKVYDKGVCNAKQAIVRKHCMVGKVYELKHLTEILRNQSDYSRAAFYAREALSNGFNLRWLAYTLYLCSKSLFGGNGSK